MANVTRGAKLHFLRTNVVGSRRRRDHVVSFLFSNKISTYFEFLTEFCSILNKFK